MHLDTKNYLKNNRNHSVKYSFNILGRLDLTLMFFEIKKLK